MKAFREQKLRGQEIRPAYPTSRFQPWNLNFRGSSDRNPYFSREMNIDNLGGGYQLDSMWLMAGEQRSCPYILDWYYTSCPHDMTDGPRGTQRDQFDAGEESREDVWKRSNSLQNKLGDDENWGHTFNDDDDRTRSHLDASTSAPLFRESSVLQQHDTNNNLAHSAKRDWWARSRPQVRDPQTSFLEPSTFFNRGGTQASFLEPPPFINRGPQTSFLEPTASTHHPQTSFVEPPSTFNRHPQASFVEPPPTSNRYPQDNYDTSPDTSVDGQENLDLRNSNRLTRTFFMDESGGDFNLPFDDIYGRRSVSSSRRSSDDAADLV